MQSVTNPEKLFILFELSRAFGALTALEELLPLVNLRTKEMLDAESCAIVLLDETRTALLPHHRRSLSGDRGGTELRSARATVEARYIGDALVRHGGNVTGAARALGMSRVTLYKKMRDLGISHAPKKS